MANSTAETIIGLARNLLRTSSSDVPSLQDGFMLNALTDANLEYLKAFRRGGGSQPMEFLREGGFDLVANTALAEDVATSDVEFNIDSSTNLDASNGAIAVWDDNMADVIFYTTAAANNVSGATQIGFAHEDDDTVQKLYKLSSLTSFSRLRSAEGYGDGIQVDDIPYYFVQGEPISGKFTTRTDGTNTFLWLPRGVTSGECSVLYEKTSSTIDSLDDTVDVPQEHQFFLVWRLVEAGAFGRQDGLEIVQYARQMGNKALLDALKDRNVGKRVRVRPFFMPYHSPYVPVEPRNV